MRNTWTHTWMQLGARVCALSAMALLSACSSISPKGFLSREELVDPATISKADPQRSGLLVQIVSTLGENDQAEAQFMSAVDVRPEDLKAATVDYRIGANDVLQISILDVLIPGSETQKMVRVTETGMITVAGLRDPVRAAGRTEAQLQKDIADKLAEAKVLMTPQVTVLVTEARQRVFSVSGAVPKPGQYGIFDSDFRLWDALIQAGEVSVPPDYIYVIRRTASERPTSQPAEAAPVKGPTTDQSDPLAPRSAAKIEATPVKAADVPAPAPAPADDGGRYIIVDGKPKLIGGSTQPSTAPVVDATAPKTAPDATAAPAFEFKAPTAADEDRRIIRIPYEPLKSGELRYNIVIRPGDLVLVPMPSQGEFYVGGHVNRPGAYSLTGRKLTVIQAIISAGMLDSMAVPDRALVIRRVRHGGADTHLFYAIDLGEIFAGRQPDIFLKPYDNVIVGTDAFAPFIAAIRSAFRISYGGGFIYDRNYAYDKNGNIR